MSSEKKKPNNPSTKRNLVQARIDLADFQEVLMKAQMHTKGNVSDFVRMAVLNYKPLKKIGVK